MKRTLLTTTAALLALGLAACGGAEETDTSDAPADEATSATEENEESSEEGDDAGEDATHGGSDAAGDASGAITLYTSEPQDKIDELIALFNESYPDVEVEVFRAGTGDLTARIETELATGDVQADVFLAADAPTFEGYAEQDLLAPLEVDTEGILEEVVDPEGMYVGTRVIPTVIAYNTTAITEPPTSWADLTDEQYADQIVMPNPDVSGAAAFNAAVWYLNEDLGESWLEGLAANTPVIADSNGPVSQAVASGTQPVGVVVDYLVRDLAAEGSPIEVSYPSEGVPYVFQPIGVFESSDNKEAAMAFADWVLSAEAQELAVEQNYLPVRTDVDSPEGAPAMDELVLMEFDLDEVAEKKAEAVDFFNGLFQ